MEGSHAQGITPTSDADRRGTASETRHDSRAPATDGAPAPDAAAPHGEADGSRPRRGTDARTPPRAGGHEKAPTPAMSPQQKAYFDGLYAETMRAYAIAKQARRKGLDPDLEVEIPPAEDLAARVEAQVGPEGVAARIREATDELGNRELVSLRVASEVASDLKAQGAPREKCLDNAVRTGLSILTEGVLVAPLEGIAEVKIGHNHDGTDYVDLWFAGPIRAAGGTGQAMSVLIADVVRRELGIGTFVPTDAEVERYKEEIPAYKQTANLQYTPTGPEIELIARHCPVCINGEGTEQEEVTGNRDLPRVESNRLRGGACLVMAEGLVLKAPKIMKHVEKLGLEGWDFLGEFLKKGKSEEDVGGQTDGIPDIPPIPKFVNDIIAGRPVFGHPSRPGAFRLRYGRSRIAGLAADAFHPASMALVDDFLAVGTQLKIERPGKGTLATPCDEIDGPTVLMKNGDLRRLSTMDEVREYRPAVGEIVDMGEILIPFGEFAENNALLPHSSWVWEWWIQEHTRAVDEAPGDASFGRPGAFSGRQMVELAETTDVPLHPDGTLLWHDLEPLEIRALSDWAKAHGAWDDGLWLPADAEQKELLVRLLCLHRVDGDRLRIEEPLAYPLVRCLGLDVMDGRMEETERRRILFDPCQPDFTTRYPSVELAGRLAGFKLMPRAPCRVGGRMGRPEKADVRKMKPPPHGLFPLGGAGGNQRLVKEAAQKGSIEVEVGDRVCTKCQSKDQWRIGCDRCGGHTEPAPERPGGNGFEREARRIDLRAEVERARTAIAMGRLPDVKGVVGVINKQRVPEPLEKALLRAQNSVWVFKDGTIRYDMTDVPATHFRPREIHASIGRLREMGYTHDMHGKELTSEDQLLEMRVQDIIVSKGCMDYFLRCARFLDDLLTRFYGLKPYYEATERDDLVGQLAIGLAPHTSGGVLCRIIGWTTAQVHYGHPYFHAAKRRNCMPGDAEVTVLNSPVPDRMRLVDLFDRAEGIEEVVDAAGTHAKEVHGIEVFAAAADGSIRKRRVRRVYRVPAPRHMLRIRLESGREITVSPHHRLETHNGALVKRKAVEVEPGMRIPVAARLPAPAGRIPDIDLWDALLDQPLEGVMVRDVSGWITAGVAQHGLKTLAETAAVPRKALDQYRRRDSVPEEVARALEATLGPLPSDVSFACKRDTARLPRVIRRGPALASLAGLHVAEGHSRTGPVHQVDFAAAEAEMKERIVDWCRETLRLSPRPQPTRVTLSGRLVYHLFTNILSLETHASRKRMPPWVRAGSNEIRRAALRACFSGDGSVERGRLHVAYHTVSRPLLRDLQTMLASFGVASRIRHERREGGGAVADHAKRTGRRVASFSSWSLHIRSQDAVRFCREIGFALQRKQAALQAEIGKVRTSRWPRTGDLALDRVKEVEPVPFDEEWLYDLEVEEDHNFLAEDLILVSNCDGDEDAVLLLMDGLLNFSRHYVPDRRGGLMDLPLVLTTRLDPNEVDKEAHNVDTLSEYPLAFYEATTRHAHAKEVSDIMGLVEQRVGKPEQYEGFGFTHDTHDIAAGPKASAYKVLDTTMEKLTAQMDLARKIRAVDEPDVGAKVIGTHLLPDIMGNLKAFSKQKVRCPLCNAKYRRMPLKGVCLSCGNPKLTLTVHEGSVRKYLEICKEIADKYHIDAYTRQRIVLLENSVESLFNNDKVRKAKLSEFF